MVPNNSAARLLIFLNFSLPTRLIWTYTLIKFWLKILPTRLLCTYTVIDFFQLTQNICYLLTNTYFTCVIHSPILSKTKNLINKVGLLILDQEDVPGSQIENQFLKSYKNFSCFKSKSILTFLLNLCKKLRMLEALNNNCSSHQTYLKLT